MAKAASLSPEEPVIAQIAKLKRLEEQEFSIELEGVTPLIPHRWSEKSINMMAEKQAAGSRRTTQQREPKNPEEEAQASCYWLGDKGAMPATAFKAATVGACRFFDSITMTIAKQLLFVVGEGPEQLVPIVGEPEMRRDTPRNSGGTPDLRYRMQFWPWSTMLHIRFVPTMIDPDSILALVDAGGRGGVGDWRPSAPKSATGTYGQYRVVTE